MRTDIVVSVVVVTFNSGECIARCIDSLLRTVDVPFEIIVLDNGSRDETLGILSSYGARITKISIGKNLGLARARNIGSRVAKGKYLAFVDHDTAVDPFWLVSGLDELNCRPHSGLLQFRVLSLRDSRLIANAGLGEDGSRLEGQPVSTFRTPRRILYAVGAGILISSSTFQQIGGFDENLFVGYDDLDFGWRARLLGFDPICVPTATVYHDRGYIRPREASRIFRYYATRNRVLVYLQNLASRSLVANLPLMILQYSIEAIICGKADGVRALTHTLFLELRSINRRRLIIQRNRIVADKSLMPWISHVLPARQLAASVARRIH